MSWAGKQGRGRESYIVLLPRSPVALDESALPFMKAGFMKPQNPVVEDQ